MPDIYRDAAKRGRRALFYRFRFGDTAARIVGSFRNRGRPCKWLARGHAALLAAATASCAMSGSTPVEEPERVVLEQMVSRFPDCEPAIRAFGDIAGLARRYGPNGWFFTSALKDLEQIIVECAMKTEDHPLPIARWQARRYR
jgi:hypothetical protein